MGDNVLNKLVVFCFGGKLCADFNIAAVHIIHLKVAKQNIVKLAQIFDNVFLDFIRIFF